MESLSGSQKIRVAVTDINGTLRGKYIHQEKFDSVAKNGFGFCSVVFGWDSDDQCYDNGSYTGWHTGFPDAWAQLDLETERKVPWDHQTPFFLADFYDSEGSPLSVCPRQTLKRVIDFGKNLGYQSTVGCEFEWFNYKETSESIREKHFRQLTPLTPGMFGYSVVRSSQYSDFCHDVFSQLGEFKVPLEGLHTETGPGVYEAALSAGSPLEAGDRGVLFKTGLKEIAARHGIMPCFMARPDDQLPGNGGHIHQSLQNLAGDNISFDSNQQHKLSPEFKSYLAGLITYLPEMLPLLAPNPNSFKRFVEGFWAPIHMTWGIDNRTCALRVINNVPASTRVEVRVGGADINPYLGIAACMAAGYAGIKNNLVLADEPIQGNAYDANHLPRLPKDLPSAINRLKDSQVAHEVLGDKFVEHFIESRTWEVQESQKAVTDWELNRYFEII